MKVTSRIRVAAVATAAGLFLAACGGGDSSGSGSGSAPTTLHLSVQAPPSDFSVGNYSGGDATISMSVYDTLDHRAVDGRLQQGIAESWE